MNDTPFNQRFSEISCKYGLNPTILKTIMEARNCGYNNVEIATMVQLNKNTVGKYIRALRKFNDDDVKTLLFIISMQKPTPTRLAFLSELFIK